LAKFRPEPNLLNLSDRLVICQKLAVDIAGVTSSILVVPTIFQKPWSSMAPTGLFLRLPATLIAAIPV
jgi:hypothetical protein